MTRAQPLRPGAPAGRVSLYGATAAPMRNSTASRKRAIRRPAWTRPMLHQPHTARRRRRRRRRSGRSATCRMGSAARTRGLRPRPAERRATTTRSSTARAACAAAPPRRCTAAVRGAAAWPLERRSGGRVTAAESWGWNDRPSSLLRLLHVDDSSVGLLARNGLAPDKRCPCRVNKAMIRLEAIVGVVHGQGRKVAGTGTATSPRRRCRRAGRRGGA